MTKYPNYTGDDAYGEVGRTVFEQGEAPEGIRKKKISPRPRDEAGVTTGQPDRAGAG